MLTSNHLIIIIVLSIFLDKNIEIEIKVFFLIRVILY